MRQQGRVIKWVDEKGFGFISVNNTSEQVFAHISAFPKGQERPKLNELVTFEIVKDVKKGYKAYNIHYINRVNVQSKTAKKLINKKSNNLMVLVLIAVLMSAVYLYNAINKTTLSNEINKLNLSTGKSSKVTDIQQNFKCEGKDKCTNMTSCEEAKFYLNHCPGSVTDGDGDGIPCEDQWCGH